MRKIMNLLWMMAFLLFLAACDTVGVEICEENHPHLSQLIIHYVWPDEMLQRDSIPEKTWVIANRPANPLRYLFGWFPESENLGREMAYLNNDSSELKKSYFDADSIDWFTRFARIEDAYDSCGIRLGDYQMITTNCTPFLLVDPISEYFHDHEVFSSEMGIKYNTELSIDSIDPCLHDWVDFNPEYPFVKGDAGPIFYDQQLVTAFKGQNTEVTFTPIVISQQIDLKFQVETGDENLRLDSIKGELSGVILDKKIFTGYLDMDATKSCRAPFRAKFNEGVRSESGRSWDCVGTVDVLGLCDPINEEMQTGPGIVHLAAYVSYINEKEEVVKRTIFWGINLYQVLQKNPVTRQTEDKFHHVVTSCHEVLVIPNVLQMRLSDFTDNGNIEIWPEDPESEKGDFDIEY